MSATFPRSDVTLSPAVAPVWQRPERLAASPATATTPLFISPVMAGFPSPATDYMDDGLDLNEYLVQHKAASYMFRVRGNSMHDAGIMDGDRVVVDRSITPRHSHIVIAVIDGEYTIKRLHRTRKCIELRAENPAYPPIQFTDDSVLEIWGVVVGVARKLPN
jgi:DNA polymerase V